MESLASLFLGLVFLVYVVYCFQHGGVHVKKRGWVTREESPKTFIFMMILFFLIGLGQLVFVAIVELKVSDI